MFSLYLEFTFYVRKNVLLYGIYLSRYGTRWIFESVWCFENIIYKNIIIKYYPSYSSIKTFNLIIINGNVGLTFTSFTLTVYETISYHILLIILKNMLLDLCFGSMLY